VFAGAAPGQGDRSGRDRVRLSFVFIGCNRIQKHDWDPADNPSSANLPQLRQSFADIAGPDRVLNPIPPYFFFTGDLVLNLAADDGSTLRQQLDAWVDLYHTDPSGISGKTTLVPLPGNHEMLQEVGSGDTKVEILNPATDAVWVDWLSTNGFDRFAGNGPTNAGPNSDLLEDDQSQLTYSFGVGDVHFVLLNTDTWNMTGSIGWIAYHWIEQDILRAQRDRRIRSIFVLGHKPIIAPVVAAGPDSAIVNPLGFQLAMLLNRNPKVMAYLAAHAHAWEIGRLGGPRSAWQVIAGNGGSRLESRWNPPGGPYYGFTLVRVYESGRVGITRYTRPVPPVYDQGPTVPAQPQREILITRRD
jgi:hypothetical protein